MVQEQLVARGIQDPRVLQAMRKIPRHLFVESALGDRAYEDGPLPIGEKQTISQPYMVALMTEALELTGEERVLEVGTGSGYQTAVLAELSLNVFSIEKIRPLAVRARAILDELGYYNVAIHVGDGTLGWSEHAPFDAIIVTAGSPGLPQPLVEQLSVGGRLVIPLGDEESQALKRIRRTGSGSEEEHLGECRFVKLWGKYGWPD
ncbi:MAG: protein-L-isoaspartate(D-aspartate) O-methyltransferase [Deltaproteobacteria bacterium]|nr:protein-L-isoaspartate(D-aspartate) O-methyltransferase [Deltaproteobacteria bacterium]